MTIDEYAQTLQWVLQDATVEASLERLIADERLAFAAEYELPSLRLTQPYSGTVTTANWLYQLPSTYQKHVFRARNGADTGGWLPIYRAIGVIDRMDHDHDETATNVRAIAVEDREFAVYPKANDTIYAWFYEKPDIDGDITEIPDEWLEYTLTPRIVLRAFRLYPELARNAISENPRALDYWRTRQREGLYGSMHTGSVGFLNYLRKSKPARRHGGRQPLP